MKRIATLFSFLFVQGFSILVTQSASAQTIHFVPVFNSKEISFGNVYYQLNKTDSVSFSTLRFYVSHIELLNDSKLVWQEVNSFHLLDVEDPKSMSLILPVPDSVHYTSIRFNLGIDSTTNVSGAMGGALDPTKGMYWTWQSGYINLKLEGTCNLSKERNNAFQFHLGGYQYPFNALQTVELNVQKKSEIKIEIDLAKFCAQLDWQTIEVMTPSLKVVDLARKFASSFSIDRK